MKNLTLIALALLTVSLNSCSTSKYVVVENEYSICSETGKAFTDMDTQDAEQCYADMIDSEAN